MTIEKKIAAFLALWAIAIIGTSTAYGSQISVPSAAGAGRFLVSTTTGQYIATTTLNASFITGGITNAQLLNSSFSTAYTGSTLSGDSVVNLGGTFNFQINFSNANTWTGLQKFSGAGTTTIANGLEVGTKIASPYFIATSTTASSTFNGITATNINLTGTASSTAANGFDLLNGCWSQQGVCLDSLVASQGTIKTAVTYASTTTLPSNTYNNGTNGVGATLTGVGNGPFYVDGNTPSVGARVLVKNEGTGANNGVYTLTQLGVAGLTPFILTRATDYNSSADVFPGVGNFVNSGTVNANTCWVLSNATAVTIGTTALTYVDTCGSGSFTGTFPIMVSGTVISSAFATTSNTGLTANQVMYTSNTGTFATAATSTLYGTCTAGQVIGWTNGALGCMATSSVAGGTGPAGPWPFSGTTAYNSTSTLTQFTGGITATASSTIGSSNSTTTIVSALLLGTANPSGLIVGSTTLMQAFGNFNSFAQVVIGNSNAGSNASSCLVLNNNLSGLTNNNYYSEVCLNGGSYSQPIGILVNERSNDMTLNSSDGGFVFGSASTTLASASSSVRIISGGTKIWEAYKNTIFEGTSTPAFAFETIATSTGPQLALSDGLGNTPWTLRSIAGNFFLATSTASATSTIAAFAINNGIFSFYGGALGAVSGGTGATSLSPAFTVSSNVFSNIVEKSVTFQATTSAGTWLGTSSIPVLQATVAGTIIGFRCRVYPIGQGLFLNFIIGNGTASTTMVNASSTNNFITTNFAVAAGDSIFAEAGTTSATAVFKYNNCTVQERI